MLSPEQSPVHRLVAPWWTGKEHPDKKTVPALRLALMQATIEELTLKSSRSMLCDPLSDARVLWGAEFLNRIGNRYYRTNPDLHARAAWNLDPPRELCGKDRAAGAS